MAPPLKCHAWTGLSLFMLLRGASGREAPHEIERWVRLGRISLLLFPRMLKPTRPVRFVTSNQHPLRNIVRTGRDLSFPP
jgi:hypothetical protein